MYDPPKTMFGENKPASGTVTTTSGFDLNTTPTTGPFGNQSTFGQPATTGFGLPAIGQSNASLFMGQQPATDMFETTTTTSSTFGSPATTQQQTGFGSFVQPQQQTTSLFGSQPQGTASTSLFGQPSTSVFGAPAKPPGFGYAATQPLFGQAGTSNPTTGFGGFGQPAAGVFSSPVSFAFGRSGTIMPKYQPVMGEDTQVKDGITTNINTTQHCITSMKEYESKSVEELRTEDYSAYRKGPQGAVGGSFGYNASQQPNGFFGPKSPTGFNTLGGGFGGTTQPAMSFGFGPPQPQQLTMSFNFTINQEQSTGLFGKPFGGPTTSIPTFTCFGMATSNNNLFGANPFDKLVSFGMFGQAEQPTTSVFDRPTATGFGAFGQSNINQDLAALFNAAIKTAKSFRLAASAPNTGFGFRPTREMFPPMCFGMAPERGTVSAAPTNFGGYDDPDL